MYIDKSIKYTIDIQTYTMTCKKKSMDTYKYANTQIRYITINRRIERKFEMLINNLHGRRSPPAAVYNRTYYNRNRYRQ